jgi:hypothetical protein
MYPGQRVLSKSHTQVTTWVPRSAGSLGCISVGKGMKVGLAEGSLPHSIE